MPGVAIPAGGGNPRLGMDVHAQPQTVIYSKPLPSYAVNLKVTMHNWGVQVAYKLVKARKKLFDRAGKDVS
jgi:hypothetical protein